MARKLLQAIQVRHIIPVEIAGPVIVEESVAKTAPEALFIVNTALYVIRVARTIQKKSAGPGFALPTYAMVAQR